MYGVLKNKENSLNSQDILNFTIKAISDRHGEHTEAYDMRGISILADYYVITSAGSNRQLHALANAIIAAAHQNKDDNYRIEGNRDSNWLLIDLGDVIVNIFTQEARDFYNLEQLWAKGKKLTLKED